MLYHELCQLRFADKGFFLAFSGSDAKAPLLPELLQQAAPLPPPPDYNRTASTSSTPQAGIEGKPKVEGERKVPKSVSLFNFYPAETVVPWSRRADVCEFLFAQVVAEGSFEEEVMIVA